MGTLTKNDIVRTLAEKHEEEIAQTRRIVQGTLDLILDALLRGDKIELRNFGVFKVVEQRERKARNPRAPQQEYLIPVRKVVKFEQGRIMDEKITQPSMKGGIQPLNRKPAESKNEPPRVPGQTNP
ncbi:MAG: HU family DNA-binding protein [Planctomycetes bacterium]|nr:HU family DNA-binding protein [Planctomycetota bacterium]